MSQRKVNIKNVYYMLSYAYRELRAEGRIDLSGEDFDNVMDLFAGILARGVSNLVKRGLARDYVARVEPLAFPKGKIDISETIRRRSLDYRKVVCSYEEHSEDTELNQVLKATMRVLCADGAVRPMRRGRMRQLLGYFSNVSNIDLRGVRWGDMRYRREDAPYRLLMFICKVVADRSFIEEAREKRGLEEYTDGLLWDLFEKFLVAYYKEEFEGLTVRGRSPINWDLAMERGELDEGQEKYLPYMFNDIRIEDPTTGDVLIIDAKWYSEPTPDNGYGSERARSEHLYQILSYVKSYEATSAVKGAVSGMLIYPEADERLDLRYPIAKTTIWIESVDLATDFHTVREHLDNALRSWKPTARKRVPLKPIA